MTKDLLDVRDLCISFKMYGDTARVIRNVNLSIGKGETMAIVGETGCGKSLTMKTVLGLISDAQVSGKVLFKDEDLLSKSTSYQHSLRGNEIGMIMQDPMSSLNPTFTIGAQMRDLIHYQGERKIGIARYLKDQIIIRDKTWRERAINVLEDVQIAAPERILNSYPHQLSGGMRQRILIAMSLLSDPDLLIADEPGTALDVTTQSKILDILQSIVEEQDRSVIYITHNLGVAKDISDRVVVMYAGQVVENAQTEELFKTPLHPYTRGLLESVPSLSRGIGNGMEGSIPDYATVTDACRFAERCPHAEQECRDIVPTNKIIDGDRTVNCHLYPESDKQTLEDTGEKPYIGPPPWNAEITERGGR